MTPRRPPQGSRLRWAVAAGWAVLVAALLWSSGPDQPPPWPWLAAFERAGGDKLVHAALFAVLAWLFCRCRPARSDVRWLTGCLALAVAYGVLTELGQLAIGERTADAADALADAAGAATAVVLVGLRRR